MVRLIHATSSCTSAPTPVCKGNLVVMNRFQTDNRFSAIQQTIAYWEALRGDRALPRRADVDPRGIEDILEFAFILERIAPGLARIRVAGSHLSNLMGMEVRGMPVSSFFTPAGRNALDHHIESLFDDPAIFDLSLSAERGIGRPALDARMVLLPMESELGDVTRALGCLVAKGDIGRLPRRFDVTNTQKRVLNGVPHTPPRVPSPYIPEGFGEEATPISGSTPTKVPYLRVVARDD